MTSQLILALIVFSGAYFLIVTEKMDRVAAAVLGASLAVFLGTVPYEYTLERIDLNVIFLLIGMMIVVNILADTGLFEWIAVSIAQAARGNGMLILLGLVTATAVLSAFLDNVTTVVLIAPITILITQILEIPCVPFLILEALFSNVGGTATLIGDPPNILIGSKAELTFNDFLSNLSPIVVLIILVLLAVVYFQQRSSLRTSDDTRRRIMRAQPRLAITQPGKLRRGLPIFLLVLLAFTLSHFMHIEPGLVALAGALVMVLATGSSLREALERVEWETILFLIGLFMLVASLEHNGVFEWLGRTLFAVTQGHYLLAALALLWLSGVLAACLGAIPVAIALIPRVQSMLGMFDAAGGAAVSEQTLWWALALGACLGGNGTLLGTAASVVVVQIARKNEYHISFMDFARRGIPVTVVSLLLSSIYLYVRYFLLAGAST